MTAAVILTEPSVSKRGEEQHVPLEGVSCASASQNP